MRQYDAISIDLDDTLWAVAPVIERAERLLHVWLSENCPRVTECRDPDHLGGIRAEIVRRHPERAHDFAFLRRAGLSLMLERAGYPAELVETAYQVFFAARNQVELFDDVVPALQRLRRDFTVVAVTNGNADLAVIGLAGLIDHTIRASEIGVAKPAPAIFAAAAAAAGVQARRMAHIGDAPVEDVAGAAAAGMTGIWINRFGRAWPEDHPRPIAEIGDLDELHDLLSS